MRAKLQLTGQALSDEFAGQEDLDLYQEIQELKRLNVNLKMGSALGKVLSCMLAR